jgi:aldose 1-epimerase
VDELPVGDGPLQAVILPAAGARVHRLLAFGHDLLRTPTDPHEHLRDPFFWGGYLMAPWCNRVAAGDTVVNGRTIRLASNFADGSAIHGQVHAIRWTQDARATWSVNAGDDGWPWPYRVTLAAAAHETDLTLSWKLTNLADEPMPAGIGFHPWWRRPLQVRVDAPLVYPSNTVPPSRPEPASGVLDLRRLQVPAAGLDATWVDPADGQVELAWPALNIRLTLRSSATHVAIATPAEPDATAVEPQSHAPDGLRRLIEGDQGGMAWLAPRAALTLDVRLQVRRG